MHAPSEQQLEIWQHNRRGFTEVHPNVTKL